MKHLATAAQVVVMLALLAVVLLAMSNGAAMDALVRP